MRIKPCSTDNHPSNKFDNAPTGEAGICGKRSVPKKPILFDGRSKPLPYGKGRRRFPVNRRTCDYTKPSRWRRWHRV